ncbi:radical SAM protein [Dactylosporangium sp. NPDC000244]|uniref:radical SAM protein n=1 Tax=Dactylosporangium sp. NPDC000244 TaxID=3154365 RepID=UPI00332071F1
MSEWTPAVLSTAEAGRHRCDLCPHRCRLGPGQVGYCQVRRGAEAGLETLTFASSVEHLDAVERKPLYHWHPGRRVLTLAAPGCSFRCDYCINFRISQYGRPGGQDWDATPVDPAAAARKVADTGAAGIALSYTEPSLAIELTLALAATGTPVVWKSNGYLTPEALALAAPAVAALNIDLKAVHDDDHRRLTGGEVAPVLAAIAGFRAAGAWVEVSTPLIPGFNDHPDQVAAIAAAVAAIDPAMPWHLLRFSPAYRMTDRDPTSPTALEDAAAIGRAAGLHYVYVERALGPAGRETRCPGCAAVVVRRDIWSAEPPLLHAGRCPECRTRIAGVWGNDDRASVR